MPDIFNVTIARKAIKDLKKVPLPVALKLQAWVSAIGNYGLYTTRKINGYHDEVLKGKRKGHHSIRLNKAYRAIYRIEKNNHICFIEIVEVNKHEY